MSPVLAMGLAVVSPFAGAFLIWLSRGHPNQREAMTFVAALGMFAGFAGLAPVVLAGARPELALIEVMPGIRLAFRAEPLGLLFGLVASFLWIFTAVYAVGYMRRLRERHQTRFYACFALALGSAAGVALAADMFTLFLFYEALTISTYPLVTHTGTQEARRAGRVYLGYLLSTSIGLQLLAIVWTYLAAGTLAFRPGGVLAGNLGHGALAALVLLYAFGVGKAALIPVHRWLPSAMVAPVPVSALLHAVAVVKAGVFTIVKVLVYIVGLDALRRVGAGEWLAYIAAATILVASVIALRQDNLKLRLAYSTVSQLGYVVLGASLGNALGVLGGSLHIATHAFGKITLFFCAGAIYIAAHKERISEMAGIGRAMPVTMGAFLLGSLSLVGLPPLGGAWSKWYLLLGTLEAHQYAFMAVLLISSLLNAFYFLPIVARAFFAPPAAGAPGGVAEAPVPCLIALAVSAAGALALFFVPGPFVDLLRPLAALAPGWLP